MRQLLRFAFTMCYVFTQGILTHMHAQDSTHVQQDSNTFPTSIQYRKLYTTIAIESAVYLAGNAYLQFIWYKDSKRVPFEFYDDSKGYLQMDKMGHAFTAYWESAAMYRALRNAGVSKRKSLIFGGPVGLIFQTPIEIFDGIYEGWGFSKSNMVANTAGAALFTVQEAIWNTQFVTLKFSFYPSEYAQVYPPLGSTAFAQLVNDYNSQTYWLSTDIKALTHWQFWPQWLNIALGYSGDGMLGEFKNPKTYRGKKLPMFERTRQFIFSPDIQLSKIPTNRLWLKRTLRMFDWVKIPFPAIEITHKGKVKGHWLYY